MSLLHIKEGCILIFLPIFILTGLLVCILIENILPCLLVCMLTYIHSYVQYILYILTRPVGGTMRIDLYFVKFGEFETI
jgi:hypothetical protein